MEPWENMFAPTCGVCMLIISSGVTLKQDALNRLH